MGIKPGRSPGFIVGGVHLAKSTKSSGSFSSGKNAPKQCTAMSKRSGERCKGPAVIGSRNERCRMHGGKALYGLADPNHKHGRFSRYLPDRLQETYQDARSNPELLDMVDHISLLESRIAEILEQMKEEDIVPRWGSLKEQFQEFELGVAADDPEKRTAAMANMRAVIEAGHAFDVAWAQIEGTMEQLRKLADTDIKRRKDLGFMIPVERVQLLMSSAALAIKRHVKDPELLKAIYNELELLRNGSRAPNSQREPNSVVPKLPNGHDYPIPDETIDV